MEKYQRVPREKDPMNANELRVSSGGPMKVYITEATKLLEKENTIIIKATGKAIARAVTATEIIKRNIKGLHQITRIGSMPITDTYEPLEEGLDKVTHERIVSFIELMLSKEQLDEKNNGYQAPLDDELIKEYQASIENRGQVGGNLGGGGSAAGGTAANVGGTLNRVPRSTGGIYRGRGRGGFLSRGGFFSRGRGGFRGRGGDGYRGGIREESVGYNGGRGGAYGGGGFRGDYSGYNNNGRNFFVGGGYRGFRGGGGGYRGFRGSGGGGFRRGRGRGFRGSA